MGFFHVSHFSIYRVNALVFNGKAVVERRGFRPKIFDENLLGIKGLAILSRNHDKVLGQNRNLTV
ncbi:MAG: hypothetical protein EWV49_03790 [Microcystis aeruginosa Ma_QC_Ch_20071001_S25]|uniref:Uncharacterized protein n=1 Tax=Microcystis aeruginosa Ma_QC_Ch_20071001_S25D TaxID=2486250 RepID=A0A552G3U5_MICAE|nr:MAG: hypothetical protein EWV49_03790 [Microcystis aeruginosa Ma_QC_Ch_20071001_S25]TRU53621.1 MAG: hypothetical protein EWV57_03445 [Microcystis aeruginosa Ma_QC_Ch_20071001_S25D]TRU62945.1 MAG: hypothetical protein EWV90_09650 [Microcystis aeruginosa Ma_QC_Ch_20071001_M135]